jgi:membrane protein YdbS with pleckstrin-like domain
MKAMSTGPAPRDPAWQVARGAIGLWTTHGVVEAVVFGIGTALFLLLVPASVGGPVPFLRWAVPVLAVIDAVVAIVVSPRLRYRVHRWEVTDDAVYTLTGWLNRTWTLVPISRIQTVDVTRGVLQQMFGLASVAVLTASSQGTVRVPHLEADVAQRVADDLTRRTAHVRDQAT